MNDMKIRKNLFMIMVFLPVQFLSCTGSNEAMLYRAVERADVEIVQGRAGLIRTLYCDLYLEYVDSENWGIIKGNSIFKGAGTGIPVDPCFHFIIVNTWNKPFEIDKIEAFHGDELIRTEDYNFIKDEKYKDNRYSVSISSLMKKRRLLIERDVLKDIDFENDSVEYRLGFIAPGDRISLFSFFPKIPAGRSTKIRVTIKYHDLKKVIDFDMGRFDYKDIENIQHQTGF
ncbi:MAG: hypothetical protein CVV49_10855 [Spirochaetae bacterium HGW-Spirochaetae-5]|nr:MAG: hypothetical protein CVV49_10855 [Spirochaetae bacterium HGW-Spirochaetae-5]